VIASGHADGVAASKLDRLSRSSIHAMQLIDQAKREGWTLVALDLGLDTSTPMGAFVATVIAGVAQLERDMIAQRTRDALAQKKLAGARLGRPVVLGAPVRERIVRERDAGKSWPSIAGGLNADGIAAARGGSWRWESVRASYRSAASRTSTSSARRAAMLKRG
jgi:DNA invertase Pin-like site-specific DNA recombinase